jgi:hypothetical protein
MQYELSGFGSTAHANKIRKTYYQKALQHGEATPGMLFALYVHHTVMAAETCLLSAGRTILSTTSTAGRRKCSKVAGLETFRRWLMTVMYVGLVQLVLRLSYDLGSRACLNFRCVSAHSLTQLRTRQCCPRMLDLQACETGTMKAEGHGLFASNCIKKVTEVVLYTCGPSQCRLHASQYCILCHKGRACLIISAGRTGMPSTVHVSGACTIIVSPSGMFIAGHCPLSQFV